MNVCVLMGSPRKEGNTAALLRPFCEELSKSGAAVEVHWLYDLEIQPCLAIDDDINVKNIQFIVISVSWGDRI